MLPFNRLFGCWGNRWRQDERGRPLILACDSSGGRAGETNEQWRTLSCIGTLGFYLLTCAAARGYLLWFRSGLIVVTKIGKVP